MPDLNKVILVGNLTRDPEVKYTPKGNAVGDLSLAINDSYKAADGSIKETVTYVDIEVWGRQAETCKEYLNKGSSVLIEGKLKLEQWEQEGKKRSKLKVRADRVQFLSTRRQSSDSAPARQERRQEEPAQTTPDRTARDTPPPPSDDDIPF